MHALSVQELLKTVDEAQKQLFKEKVNQKKEQGKNTRQQKQIRKKIAIAKTIIRQHELSEKDRQGGTV